jgi:hypothetical protein
MMLSFLNQTWPFSSQVLLEASMNVTIPFTEDPLGEESNWVANST